ncbi:MAG: RNA 2',3'-cyclic phosphodiesterase [Pseudomonadota bacterium]
MIRAFVALPLPREAAWALEGAQAGLPCGRPVPPENFHITLAFLGEQRGDVIDDLHSALSDIRAPGFEVTIAGVGLFGGMQPTSLYARVVQDPALSHLRDKVLQAARRAGIAVAGSRFVPHVTLARFGGGLRGEDAAAMQGFVATRLALTAAPFQPEAFVLFRSRLGKRVSYDPLAEYPLVTGWSEDAALSAGW